MTRPPHLWPACQRWHQHTHSWVPRRHGGFDAARYQVTTLDEAPARAFAIAHHYSSSWPSAIHRYGMVDRADGSLAGVLVLAIPMHPNVLLRHFPDLEP